MTAFQYDFDRIEMKLDIIINMLNKITGLNGIRSDLFSNVLGNAIYSVCFKAHY